MKKKKNKEEFIGIRIDKEFKSILQKKAKKKGISLSELLTLHLGDLYQSDKEQIQSLIKMKKEERPLFWEEYDQSTIATVMQEQIVKLYVDYFNPTSTNTEFQPYASITVIASFMRSIMKHFESVPDECKCAALCSIMCIGEAFIDCLAYIKSKDPEMQKSIIDGKAKIFEQIAYHFTAMALDKNSYMEFKRKIEEIQSALIYELKK